MLGPFVGRRFVYDGVLVSTRGRRLCAKRLAERRLGEAKHGNVSLRPVFRLCLPTSVTRHQADAAQVQGRSGAKAKAVSSSVKLFSSPHRLMESHKAIAWLLDAIAWLSLLLEDDDDLRPAPAWMPTNPFFRQSLASRSKVRKVATSV